MSVSPLYQRPLECFKRGSFLMSGLDGSGAVHTVLPWEAFGGHVPPRGSIKSILKRILASGARRTWSWPRTHLVTIGRHPLQ